MDVTGPTLVLSANIVYCHWVLEFTSFNIIETYYFIDHSQTLRWRNTYI